MSDLISKKDMEGIKRRTERAKFSSAPPTYVELDRERLILHTEVLERALRNVVSTLPFYYPDHPEDFGWSVETDDAIKEILKPKDAV